MVIRTGWVSVGVGKELWPLGGIWVEVGVEGGRMIEVLMTFNFLTWVVQG